MAYAGRGPLESPVERPTVLGLVAAVIWVVGPAVGVSALVAGYPVAAGASVVLALGTPWLALAWNLHARLRADDVELPFAGGRRVPIPAG